MSDRSIEFGLPGGLGGHVVARALGVLAMIAAAGASAFVSAQVSFPDRAPIAAPEVWFDELVSTTELDADDVGTTAGYIWTRLANGTPVPLPDSLATDRESRILFISLSDGTGPADVTCGAGRGLRAAVEAAIKDFPTPVNRRPFWLKLDMITRVLRVDEPWKSPHLDHERSLFGLAFSRKLPIAFLPEELTARTLLDSENALRPKNVRRYLNEQRVEASQIQQATSRSQSEIYRFETRSCFTDGRQTELLYRGHRVVTEFSADELLSSAGRIGDYLQRSVDDQGRFLYRYFPKTDSTTDSYNILRHAGTAYAMLELYGVTKDPHLLQAAQRALAYLAGSAHPPRPQRTDQACIVENGEVKLGGNGLALVAFSKYAEVTKDRRYLPLCQRLARWVASSQDESGMFLVHKQSYPDGTPAAFRSEYYPGEALLGLCRLYRLDKRDAWLDVCIKNARYAIRQRDAARTDAQLPHDHWFLYALNELHRLQPDPSYLDHTRRLVRVIVSAQNRQPEYQDWLGGFSRPPQSTRTATRCEGLCAAYELLRDFGSKEELPPILEAVQLGTRLQFAAQILPETALYLPNPQRSLYGIRKNLTDYTLQIDYQQHSISSMLGLRRILTVE